jgi:hypothetical protein
VTVNGSGLISTLEEDFAVAALLSVTVTLIL